MTDSKEFIAKLKCLDREEKLKALETIIKSNGLTIDELASGQKLKNSTAYKYVTEMLKAGIIKRDKRPGKKGMMAYRFNELALSITDKTLRDMFSEEERSMIIFDVDDTLVRRNDIQEQLSGQGKEAIEEARYQMSATGCPITEPPAALFSPKWIHSKYGNPIGWYISAWLTISGLQGGEYEQMLTKKHIKKYYDRIEKTAAFCDLFSDVRDFLLRHKAVFAAFSNSSKKTILDNFRRNGILEHFRHHDNFLVIGGDEIPKSKETVLELCRMADVKPYDCFLVGDTSGDIKAGREAGIPPSRTIAIDRGITPVTYIREIRPRVRIIKSLSEL